MRKLMAGLMFLLLGAMGASAANLVSVSNGTGTVEYATITDALATCSGGETLTLLGDVSVGARITVNAPVTIDLDGHALGCSAKDVNFLWVGNGVSGFTVKNGSLFVTGTCANIVPAANSSVTVSNVTFTGFGVCWSSTGGRVTLNDCLVRTQYVASSDAAAGTTMTLEGDTVLAPTKGFYNRGITGTTLELHSARSSSIPRDICAAFGASFVYDPATVRDIDCDFHILSAEAAANLPAVYVISADGVISNGYHAIGAAISDSQNGQTISLIKDCTVSTQLTFSSSINMELNGLCLHNTGGDFLKPAAGVTVNINGTGGTISIEKFGSVFSVNSAGSCFNVTNCVVNGYCAVFGTGTVNFYNAVNLRNCNYLASGGGSASLNVYGGTYSFRDWRDSYNNPGTTIRFYGGYLDANHNPYSAVYTPLQVLGEGCRVFYSDRFAEYPHEVVSSNVWTNWSIEASNAGLFYTNLNTALQVGWNGSTVKQEKDLARQVKAPTSNTRRSFTLDMQGHQTTYGTMYYNVFTIGALVDLTVTNGVVLVNASDTCCFAITEPNSALTAKSGTELLGASNCRTGGFYMNATNTQVVLDGALLRTTYLASWGAGGTHSSITVRGDGTNVLTGFLFPNTSIPASSTLAVCGGWWSIDPSAYVPANHVKLYHASLSPCKWRVKTWADICGKGWMFDSVDGVATATGVCEAVPSEPIVVSLAGEVPLKKTTLVDLKGLTFSAGALTVDSFACDPDWPPTAKLTLTDGVLSVQNCLGTTVLIR